MLQIQFDRIDNETLHYIDCIGMFSLVIEFETSIQSEKSLQNF